MGVPSPNVARTGEAQLAFADRIRQKLAPSEEKIAIFENALVGLLRNPALENARVIHLDVDYHASGLLREACLSAKIDSMSLPWKTNMLLSNNLVQVRKDGGKPFYLYWEEGAEDV